MFSKVLVATDLSEASERVIGALGGLGALGAREALLLHCLNLRDVGTLAPRLMELTKPSLERQRALLSEQGFKVTAEIALGLPHIEIIRHADEHDCSLIAIGSHGQTMAAEILLGGVANAVIQSAARPVLILHLRLRGESGRTVCEEITCDPRGHVLFPTDFSDIAGRALSYLEQIVRRGGRRVTLLHVQDKNRIYGEPDDKVEAFDRTDRERLERIGNSLKDFGATEVNIQLPHGFPKQEIIRSVDRGDYSLIVMGAQGRGFFGELFIGGIAHHVARNTAVPTLLIPPLR